MSAAKKPYANTGVQIPANDPCGGAQGKLRPSPPKLTLTLPIPPSTNNAYANNHKTKGRSLTPKGRAYKADTLWLAYTGGARTFAASPPYSLTIVFYFPDIKKRDVANFEKLLTDTLMGAINSDDQHIHDMRLIKRVDRKRPRAEVTLRGSTGEAQ